VSVTRAPALTCWAQSVAHAIPSGSLVTMPPVIGVTLTLS
jgi:hypothetical protein